MFTANDVKTLREKTGAGMLDCKKALQETNGNMDDAIDWLREKGISKAAKKQDRIAADGLAKIAMNDSCAVVVEVNSETDFVAKNEAFQNGVEAIANCLLNHDVKTLEEANKLEIDGQTIEQMMIDLTAKIGEKLSFRRFARVEKTPSQVFGSYSHMGGRIAALVVLEGGNSEVAKDVAMHVAAMNPRYINRDLVDQEVLDHEAKVIKEQVMNEGKPAEIAEKMVTGRLNKFYKEICLLEQPFIKDSNLTIEQYVKQHNASIVSMVRFEVGEGIEKKQEDFASEVMSQING